jgi:hypothetical protein
MMTPEHILGPADLAPPPPRARRIDAGMVRLSQRDIDAFLLCAEHYAALYDLLAETLGVNRNRFNDLLHRWRQAGHGATARLGPGPLWCWLTRSGMAATGLGYSSTRPALARLAHYRAVMAARLWLASGQVWAQSWQGLGREGLLHPPRRGHLCPGGPAHAVAAEPACRSGAGRCARAGAGKHAGGDAADVARTRAARCRRRPRS